MIKNIMKNIGVKPVEVEEKDPTYIPRERQIAIRQINKNARKNGTKQFADMSETERESAISELAKDKAKLFDEYKLPTKEAILKRNEFLKGKNVDPKTLKNEEFNTLAKELDDALGIGDLSLSQELLVSDDEEEKKDEEEK